MATTIIELNNDNFQSTVEGSSKPTVVDFWAPWCGPCKALTPILEELSEEMGDAVQICKVNVDENQEIARKYNVRAIPTLLFFRDGKMVDQSVGLPTKDSLKQKLA
jgi:thioredoxin 1